MDLATIKRMNLKTYLNKKYGIEFNERGYAICPFHTEQNPSFQVSFFNGVWRWTDWHKTKGQPGFSGTLIDFVARIEQISIKDAIARLKTESVDQKTAEFLKIRKQRRFERKNQAARRKEYIYKDAKGHEVYKKVKLKDKTGNKKFWFEKKINGLWQRTIGNFHPMPYNLDRFKDYDKLIICEGEKDADNVNSFGINFLATSAPTGAHNWDDRLTPYFANKQRVFFLYDVGNERDVHAHAAKLQNAFPDMPIFISRVPLDSHEADISDYLKTLPTPHRKKDALLGLLKKAIRFVPPSTQRLPVGPVPAIELQINNRFLRRWVDSLSKITDAPKVFLLFSGIALLSGLLNKFYFKYPRETHLNLYILLLAPSTYYRKSTCTTFVADYLEEVNPDLRLPDSFTVEALYDILRERSKGLIIWPELIQVKEFQMTRKYNEGLGAFLTDIYDFKKRLTRWTRKDGEIVIEEPVVSILTAGITDWFTKNLQANDFHGGIWTRFLFVPSPETDRRFSLPRPFELDPGLVQLLTRMDGKSAAEVSLAEIQPKLKDWGARHQQVTMSLGTGILSAMFQRLEVMLIKLAAILQLSHDGSLTITPITFREAVKIIEYLKAQLPAFFNAEIQFGEFEKARATILKFIKKKRRAMKKEILQGTKIPKKLADPALQQLVEEEEIKEEEIPASGHGGRRGVAYIYIGSEVEER